MMTDIIGVMTQAAMEDSSAIYPKQWITAALKAAKAEGWELVKLPIKQRITNLQSERDKNIRTGFNACLGNVERLELEP